MSTKQIKIIKRDARDRPRSRARAKNVPPAAPPPRDEAREVMSTITGWVQEHRQRQEDGPLRSFRALFRDPLPQTGGR